jgi:hypothetical protein
MKASREYWDFNHDAMSDEYADIIKSMTETHVHTVQVDPSDI